MKRIGLETFLEEGNLATDYSILGGLSDDLLTVGTFAGSFYSCCACGQTFSLARNSWGCRNCGNQFGIHFKPPQDKTLPINTMARLSGVSKASTDPHWYYIDENLCVAEFLSCVLRLPADAFLPVWLKELGVKLTRPPVLENITHWPRLRLDKMKKSKTLQPDCAIGFKKALYFFSSRQCKIPRAGLTG